MAYMDRDQSGTIDYDELLYAIRVLILMKLKGSS